MHDDEWFTLAELNERLGQLLWVETQLGEVLVSWSAIEPLANASIAFSVAGRHHQWHQDVLTQCLATSPSLRDAELIRPPTDGWADAVQTLRGLVDTEATSARLRSLHRVVNPWLARETGALLELARPVSDAAVARWLRFIELDHRHDDDVLSTLVESQTHKATRFEDHVVVNELDLTR